MTLQHVPRPDLIQVTYRLLSDTLIDPEKKAKGIALGQTTDTWTPNARSGLNKLERHRGAVVAIDERTHVEGKPYEYYLTIGYPAQNTDGDIPSLLTMIFGKISMDGRIRVESVRFPDDYLFGKGPRHGIAGVRTLVGEPAKPLAMAIFKPCVGLSSAELAGMFYELALGGMHLVKDDEILADLPTSPTLKRLAACLEAGEKAFKETGRRTLYAVNLTGPASKLLTRARKLAAEGAQCFLFNVLSYGFGALEELRALNIPIMAHPALAGALCSTRDHGFAYSVLLGTLMRLGGADIVLFPSSYGTVALPQSDTLAIWKALTQTMGSLVPAFPAPSAGIHPGLVPKILNDFGMNVIVNAGGGVHGHPQGARAGAKAVRQAIDWILKRRNWGGLPESSYPELAAALRLWGRG
jgi:2,3-diketo-5-methylthiopentyl-1-phosphate enolase